MSMREWLLAAGIVLIAGVIVHLLWDIWRRRREVAEEFHFDDEDYDEFEQFRSELPNGGGRVVKPAAAAATGPGGAAETPAATTAGVAAGVAAEPPANAPGEAHTDGRVVEPVATAAPPAPEQQRLIVDEMQPDGHGETPINARGEDRIGGRRSTLPGRRRKPEAAASGAAKDQDPLVVVLHVVCRDATEPFAGTDIRELTDTCSLRFGDMDIFHRYRTIPGSTIQYSLANGVEPGTFDIADLAAFTSPSLVFFMQLPGPEAPLEAFDAMLTAARRFAERLDGDLCDDKMNVCTKQTIEHTRQQITEFQRKQQLSRRG
jgi:cell division protein ZipA